MTAAVLLMQNPHSDVSITRPKNVLKSVKAQLPAIAPRYQLLSEPDAGNVEPKSNVALNVPRTRLPPRSRFGCWTCRTRKVKCDEARPECTPCSRLGHPCDYNPRLSFKDDTPRVLEKMSGATKSGGPIWDRSARRLFKRQRMNEHDDFLPQFSGLTNDEGREKKAEYHKPGTFLLILNPESFADYEEYKDAQASTKDNPTRASISVRTDHLGIENTVNRDDHSAEYQKEVPGDPNSVILRIFEDDAPKILSPESPDKRQDSSTPSLSIVSTVSTQRSGFSRFSYDNTPLMRVANKDGRDHPLIYYYKNFVCRHLAQVHRDSLGTSAETGYLSAPDVFERQAAVFEPLYHALMAFSAISMSFKSGIPNLDALQHYQKALPSLQASLRTEADLTSEGVFLTHFILLLYEISAGEPRGLSLWAQHIDQLRRITLLRHQIYGCEPYPFIVWWVANIDTHVVLSGMGNGEFIETMLSHNLLSTGKEPQNTYPVYDHTPTGALSPSLPSEALPSALAFHRRICILAAELALLARDLRAEERATANSRSPGCNRRWQERISVLQDTLRRTWNVQMPLSIANGYCNQILPVGARGIFEHSFALYHALLIYSHTSMYATQLQLTTSPSLTSPFINHNHNHNHNHNQQRHQNEPLQSCTAILHLAREIVSNNHLERKFIVFPLFMAGFVSRIEEDRREILSLVRRMEEDSVGRNLVAVRELLERVYERQGGGGKRERVVVDWVGLLGELGLQVVNCRL